MRKFVLITAVISVSASCVYRFTNAHLQTPQNIHSIAIEGIYDTSRTPLPHEILWENLQAEFITSGRLAVVGVDKADAYLRVHVHNGEVNQYDVYAPPKISEPDNVFATATGEAHPLSKYSNLRAADQYSRREVLSFALDVEVWSLRERKLLFQKTYQAGPVDYSIYDGRTAADLQFINAEEGFGALFDRVSKNLAQAIVTDFLSKRSEPSSVAR